MTEENNRQGVVARSLQWLVDFPTEVRRRFVRLGVSFMTDPARVYAPSEVTNLGALKKRLKLGDVLLVSGHARISYVVKLLTISQWSHVVLYVGDRRELIPAEDREEWIVSFGESSLRHLVVDADPIRGVHLKPLDELVGLMVRQCRPAALAPDDVRRVIDIALSELGKHYDLKHILRLLLFYALPFGIMPARLRRLVTEFTLSESDTICSRVLSDAFHAVGYPIRPLEVIQNRRALYNPVLNAASAIKHRGRSAMRLLAGGRIRAAYCRLTDRRYLEVMLKSARYITPGDYDLSRYFLIIKEPSDLAVNYRELERLVPVVRGFEE